MNARCATRGASIPSDAAGLMPSAIRDLAELLEALRVDDVKLVAVRPDSPSTLLFPAEVATRFRATSPTVNMEVSPAEAQLLRVAGARERG
jgi:hypothetical protein